MGKSNLPSKNPSVIVQSKQGLYIRANKIAPRLALELPQSPQGDTLVVGSSGAGAGIGLYRPHLWRVYLIQIGLGSHERGIRLRDVWELAFHCQYGPQRQAGVVLGVSIKQAAELPLPLRE